MNYQFIRSNKFTKLNKLNLADNNKNSKDYLKKLVRLSLSGTHISDVCCNISQYLTQTDIATKKLACWLITKHWTQDESWVLLLNTLVLFSQDSNPIVRVMTLKCIVSIDHPDALPYAFDIVIKSLDDESIFLKRAAVSGIGKLWRKNTFDFEKEALVFKKLMSLLQLNDAALNVHTIMVLYEMTHYAEKRGFSKENLIFNIDKKKILSSNSIINKSLILHLLNHFHDWGDFHKSLIINIISKFQPASNQEILIIMNKLDYLIKTPQQLTSQKKSSVFNETSLCVSTATISTFLQLCRLHLPKLLKEVFHRTSAFMIEKCQLQDHPNAWSGFNFILNYYDIADITDLLVDKNLASNPVYLKRKKIQLISRFTTTIENENTLVKLFDMLKSFIYIENDDASKYLVLKSLKQIMLNKNENLEIFKTNVFLYSMETLKRVAEPRIRLPFLIDLLIYFSKNYHQMNHIDLGINNSQITNFMKNNIGSLPIVQKLSVNALITPLLVTAYLEFESWKNVEPEIEKSLEKFNTSENIDDSIEDSSQINSKISVLTNDDPTEEFVNSIFSGIKPIKNPLSGKSEVLIKVCTFNSKILNEDNTVKKLYYEIDRLIESLEHFSDENQNSDLLEKNNHCLSNSVNLKEILLIVVSVLYVVHPSIFSHILSRVFELCYSNSDSFLRFKCLFYIQLLEKNPSHFENFLKSLFENLLA